MSVQSSVQKLWTLISKGIKSMAQLIYAQLKDKRKGMNWKADHVFLYKTAQSTPVIKINEIKKKIYRYYEILLISFYFFLFGFLKLKLEIE
ncbi:hypothetical protein BpHYR1_034419 [Brachionus plicatilis]|uniref:Uncharacterized protein n=1 Tax=Brachionus plicatilis TaxID=10195 RepID=A0A3M7TAN8_BRAPC|nr:hypothetical protein BpHYR1_034419 [Brachionus plicatilis]